MTVQGHHSEPARLNERRQTRYVPSLPVNSGCCTRTATIKAVASGKSFVTLCFYRMESFRQRKAGHVAQQSVVQPYGAFSSAATRCCSAKTSFLRRCTSITKSTRRVPPVPSDQAGQPGTDI